MILLETPLENRLKRSLDDRISKHLYRTVPEPRRVRINLSGNDYLNLRNHPEVVRAASEASNSYGTGSGASPLLSGYCQIHHELLESLKNWIGKSAGLLFNTGFMANQALIHHLPGINDLVLADRLVHHSFQQALAQGRKNFSRFSHNDLDQLEKILNSKQGEYETVFVVTESLYSMDGDTPDLKRLSELKNKYGFVWILDEAHALGIYGDQGRGLAQEREVLAEVDILVGTLGKSFASMGAFVLTNSRVITDFLTNFAGEMIYSTFFPPGAAGAAMGSLDIIKNSRETAQKLKYLSKSFRKMLKDTGHKTLEGDSPIIPLILEDTKLMLLIHSRLLERGILTGAVRPPTVPQHTSRLRISLHSGISQKDLNEMLEIVTQCEIA